MIGLSGLGLVSSLLMRELPLQNVLDETWGLQDGDKQEDTNANDRSESRPDNVAQNPITVT